MKSLADKPKTDMRDKVSHYFTLALCLVMIVLMFQLFSAFAGAMVGAVALGIAFYPLHHGLKKKFPKLSPSFRAFLSDFIVVLFIILPLFLMIWAAVEQSDAWSPLIRGWQSQLMNLRDGKILDSNETVKGLWGWLHQTFAIRPSEARGQLTQMVDRMLGVLGALGGRAAAELVASLGNIGMMIFVLFFIFRDGEVYYAYIESFLPLREEEKADCQQRGKIIVTGVIRGWFLGAMIQGAMGMIGYGIAGIGAWIIFGVLTMIAGLLPVVGTALVWVPLAVNAFLGGHPGKGIFLLGWGFLIVGLIDNVLRPYLVGKDSDISFFILFVSLLGGVEVWGFKGIILGPVIVAIAPVIFDVYKKRYTHEPDLV